MYEVSTGLQAMFPVYLPRSMPSGMRREEYDMNVAQNENNLNQNFSILYQKLFEIEQLLAMSQSVS